MSRARAGRGKATSKRKQARSSDRASAASVASEGGSGLRWISRDWVVVSLLVVTTLAVFQPVLQNSFVNYDDVNYIVESSIVREGATWQGIVSAFTTNFGVNWVPLTVISFQLEYPFFGVSPTGYLVNNVLLHTLSSVLLFLALARMTGSRWRSAFVAAMFALHPLHVESVAWAAERKDTLSGLFWMSTLLAYAHWATRARSLPLYCAVLTCLTLGLLSKPMVVTLPFVLLLLDYWPLRRLAGDASNEIPEPQRLGSALLEKLPMFLLVTGSSVVTFAVQRGGGMMYLADQVPLTARVANALVSYVAYLRDTVWPSGLAVFYPHPLEGTPLWHGVVAGAFLVGVSLVCLRAAASRAYLIVGWLWYLGTLVPVIGLVQVGHQARADRYVYLPMIGIAIMLAWGVPELVARLVPRERARRITLAVAGLATLGSWAVVAHHQVHYWRDAVALFGHATAVTRENSYVRTLYGNALMAEGRLDEANRQFAEAMRIRPTWSSKLDLANVTLKGGNAEEAVVLFREVLRSKPDNLRALGSLGLALLQTGDTVGAQATLERAIALEPAFPVLHIALGNIASQLGHTSDALELYRHALELSAGSRDAANNVAWILATAEDERLRDPEAAVRIAYKASLLPGRPDPGELDTLAAAYAAAGRYEEAARTADRAADIAEERGQSEIVAVIRQHAALFRSGKPYVEKANRVDPDRLLDVSEASQ